jgi:long-chain fatty acid transport protein
VTFNADLHWPQKAMAGIAVKPIPKLKVAGQIDWTDWSSFQEILVHLSTGTDFSFPQDFHDAFAVHLGAEYQLNQKLAVRGGYTYDGNAVPDRTIDRQYVDDVKHLIAVGGSYVVNDMISLDAAFEILLPLAARTVPDNSTLPGHLGRNDLNNIAPGKHLGRLYTTALAATFAF